LPSLRAARPRIDGYRYLICTRRADGQSNDEGATAEMAFYRLQKLHHDDASRGHQFSATVKLNAKHVAKNKEQSRTQS
jgi:hypothetical protein